MPTFHSDNGYEKSLPVAGCSISVSHASEQHLSDRSSLARRNAPRLRRSRPPTSLRPRRRRDLPRRRTLMELPRAAALQATEVPAASHDGHRTAGARC